MRRIIVSFLEIDYQSILFYVYIEKFLSFWIENIDANVR